MSRDGIADVLTRFFEDVRPIHAQYHRGDLSLGDFEYQVELLIDAYTDQFFEIESA